MASDFDKSVNQIGMHRGREIDLKCLAMWDFRMDWAVIAMLIFVPGSLLLLGSWKTVIFLVLATLALGAWGWTAWCTHRIMVELKDQFVLLLTFWLMVPCLPLGMIYMGVIAMRSARVLSRHGIKVGFFGIKRQALRELSPGMCRYCGYDVRSIRTGVCPECGGAIEQQ